MQGDGLERAGLGRGQGLVVRGIGIGDAVAAGDDVVEAAQRGLEGVALGLGLDREDVERRARDAPRARAAVVVVRGRAVSLLPMTLVRLSLSRSWT